ncbi:MAG: peptidylprolyl isomerase [Clostridiales Family XIII bacterium]|jgi:parvulin-like peptidyl-prolyl isomerase|nr:peptidylprolyl isomerase [Clostridiales Family XIII bacterium]
MKNKSKNKILALCLSLALIVGAAAGCGDKAASKGELLAEVNGNKIYEQETLDFAKTWILLNNNYAWSEFDDEQKDELVRSTYLSVLIDNYLVIEYLKERDITEKDIFTSEVKSQIKDGIAAIKVDENIGEMVTSEKITDEMIEECYRYVFYSQAFTQKVEEEMPVSDEEIQTYYDEHQDEFATLASINVSHILIKDEEHTAAKKAEIEAILKKAKAGDDFAELAKEYSDDGSAESGGDLGAVTEETSFVQEFKDAALALKKEGDLSGIVESEYGFHIIKATSDMAPAGTKTLEEARDDILQTIQGENIMKIIEELRAKAKITYDKGIDPDAPAAEETPEGEDAPAADPAEDQTE